MKSRNIKPIVEKHIGKPRYVVTIGVAFETVKQDYHGWRMMPGKFRVSLRCFHPFHIQQIIVGCGDLNALHG